MSEDAEKYKGSELDTEIYRISMGASRWQEPKKTDLLDVLSAYNVYQTSLQNPTKDPKESIAALYDKIGEANSLILDGSEPEVLDKALYVVNGVQKKLPTMFDPRTLKEQLSKLEGKDLKGRAVVLLFSNNMKMSGVIDIPL